MGRGGRSAMDEVWAKIRAGRTPREEGLLREIARLKAGWDTAHKAGMEKAAMVVEDLDDPNCDGGNIYADAIRKASET